MKKFLSFLGIFAAGVIAISLIFTILAHVARKNNPPAEEVFGDGATTISITAVGDCFFGSDINAVGPGDFDDVFKKAGSDYSYCFKNVKRYFEADDFTIVNYEGCISDRGTRFDKQFAFRTNPDYVKILTESSVEAANIANNHTRDYGEGAFEDTKKILTENGIVNFVGNEVAIAEKNGVKVGFVGTNTQRYGGKAEVIENINKLKKENAELIIASFHWGIERTLTPNDEQRELAYLAIDNGADLVIGHHPHVIQGIEKYKGKYILYSLGNFCFGGNKNPADKDSMIFKQVFVLRDGKVLDKGSATVIPCSISSETDRNNYQPTPLSDKEFDRVKKKILDISKGFDGIEDITFIQNYN